MSINKVINRGRHSNIRKWVLLDLVKRGKKRIDPDRINHFKVQHEAWCALYRGRNRCNCSQPIGEVHNHRSRHGKGGRIENQA